MTSDKKPERTTFLLILDAFRADYITPNNTPYLAGLKKESTHGGFLSPPGFAQRTTMFTGTYPDTSGNFSAYGYDPENSPFTWVRSLGPLAKMYRGRLAMVPARAAVKRVTKMKTGNFHTDPAWIPGEFLPYFELVEDTKPVFDPGALPFTSVFDLCREKSKPFFYGAHPVSGDDEEIYNMVLERIQRRDPTELYVAQFSAMDEGCHRHGPILPPDWTRAEDQSDRDIEKMRRELLEIDRKIRVIHEHLQANYENVNLLILGDHGMAPVRRRVNVLKDLKSTGMKPSKDYVVFLDSTFAKIWFRNETARRRITAHLEGVDYGWMLSPEERRALRIDFKHRRYGDLMLAAKPGVLFWPDYFHIVERPIKGMHGYIDKREETESALLLHGPDVPRRDVGKRVLVDVFSTLTDLVGLPGNDVDEGVSLLSKERPPAQPEILAPKTPLRA
jgi:hypothetical protein